MVSSFADCGTESDAGDDRPGLFDRDAPDLEYLRVGTGIEAAVVAVADGLAHGGRRKRAQAIQIGHRLLLFRRWRHAVPGKVLHPRAVRGHRIERLHGLPGAES